MQTRILSLISGPIPEPAPQAVLSFRPYIEYLKKRKDEANCHKSRVFSYVIEQFEQHPELLEGIDVNDVHRYSDQLQLIYTTLSPVVSDEEQHYWSLSVPIKPVIFYSTNALYGILEKMFTHKLKSNVIPVNQDEIMRDKLAYSYSFILERLYGVQNFFSHDMIRAVEDPETGLTKYYKQNLDTRFIEIHTLKPLPELDLSEFQSPGTDNRYFLPQLQELLPLDMFRFEGFSIVSVEEVTAKFAVENIKTMLLEHRAVHEEDYYARFVSSLKSLIGSSDTNFGLLPFLKVNDHFVFMDKACHNSVLSRLANSHAMISQSYETLITEFSKDPKLFFIKEITPAEEARKKPLKLLRAEGVVSYALLPIYFNNSLLGALEVYSDKPGVLTRELLSRLDSAMPLLAQLLKNTVDEFNGSIEKVIKEKFTAVQPSVQWKFNEVAWKYLEQRGNNKHSAQMPEDIIFDDVYPLYGAVDIRNSTVQRNEALRLDLMTQFEVLLEVFQDLKSATGFGLLDEKIFVARQWLGKVAPSSSVFNQEIDLNDYLENDITPFLEQFVKGQPQLEAITAKYFEAVNEKSGSAHEHRRQLESSMHTVISAVNNYLEMLKDEIQQAYPSYFEKFRTDGVEYDIYIGQSITPTKPYSDIYLKNLRLLQLTSMAAIAKYTHSLREQLHKEVETTQLIFIHSHPIDIKFRTDEKRFDVEGAYNIRYHIIKKRIDKVRIKNTKERLTQPNKIALVYFNQKEADEYINYIQYLQGQGLLKGELEHLELEELQGVSGLKALRVEVNLAHE